MLKGIVVAALLLVGGPAIAQQLYKCSDGKGGTAYQQTQCTSEAATKKVVKYKRTADVPNDYGQYGSPQLQWQGSEAAPTRQQQIYQAPVEDRGARLANGYVKCTSPQGGAYIASGKCKTRVRTSPVDPRPGMVQDVRTGQQHFMTPTGSSSFNDPATGQRYNRIGPPPSVTVRTQDRGQGVSQDEVCAQARADLKNYNRTMNSIREAERRVAEVCGR